MRLPLGLGIALVVAACSRSPESAVLPAGTVVSDVSLERYVRYQTACTGELAELKRKDPGALSDPDPTWVFRRAPMSGLCRRALEQSGLKPTEAAEIKYLVSFVVDTEVYLEESALFVRRALEDTEASGPARAELEAQLIAIADLRRDLPHQLEQARARYGAAAVEVVLRNKEPLADAERARIKLIGPRPPRVRSDPPPY